MKTFKQFQEETRQLDEALPALIPLALKLGGKALTAYSAYSAGKNLIQGKPKQAAFDAMGAIPGGRIFKGIRALGAGKKLSKLGSASQSIARYSTDNPFARGVDKVFNTAGKYAKKAYDKIKK